ncbi:MAG: dihydroorotate dehydrogenase-like protein [Deltaproteobacteria bacterium]|nr:dihydroorotate dehydrogenase-like protein [Deltaproteobacteria bacterium]
MDLSTTYLGLRLPHPLMPGASPLVDDLDQVRRLEDAGAAAIVMHSLFEEQITLDQLGTIHSMEIHEGASAEALSYFPDPSDYRLGPDQYLEQLRRIKDAVAVPIVASLNGTTPEGWLAFARLLENAGADALELNVYHVASSPDENAVQVEERLLEVLRTVRRHVRIPLALKLSPFYSALANLAQRLDAEGIDGLVLFNRFYQPEIDIEALEVKPYLHLSDSSELLLRLRWLAILSGRVRASLAVTGGVHSAIDVIKAVMAGANAVQMVSALLQHGPEELQKVRTAVEYWMEQHEYESLAQMQGSMNLQRCPDPTAFERANYMRVLQSWRG